MRGLLALVLLLFAAIPASAGWPLKLGGIANGSAPPPAPVITSSTTATGTTGSSFFYQITATNSPTSYSASGLPSWASLNTSNGQITGTPDAAATTNATINATNAGGTGSGPLAITITSVGPPPPFSTTTYHAFGDSITVGTGGTNPYPNTIAADNGWTLTNQAQVGVQSGFVNSGEIFPHENPGDTGNPIDTILIGTNDVGNGIGPYELEYINNLESAVSWLGIGTSDKMQASSCTLAGNWYFVPSYMPSGSMGTSVISSTASCVFTPRNGVLYAWYQSAGFTYSIDGGSPQTGTPSNLTSQTIALLRITGLSAGPHTLLITDTSGLTRFTGVGTPPATQTCCRILLGGVLREQNDTLAATTAAYDADAQTAYSALYADGINVAFVPVRNYVNDTTDMADSLHPNNSGYAKLVQAFEAYIAPTGSYTGPCDIRGCAEAFSLNSAMTASYSGPLFQVIQGTPGSTNPSGLTTHDAIQTGAHKLDIADLTSFCGAPTFIASGTNVPTGGVYIYGCLVSKIYAQIHTGANDEVPSYFRCSNPNCYGAIALDSTQTVAQILVGTGNLPTGFINNYAAEYIVAGDAPATGIPAGTSPLSIMANYFFAQDTSPCCTGFGVGETWNNPLNDAAGLATMGGVHATGYALTGGCGPGDTINYCINIAIQPADFASAIVADHPVNNVELFAIDGTSSHNWTDDANGATLITSSNPSWNLTDGAHLRCGGGADLTWPGALWFREGAFWNSSLGSTDRAAIFANEQARYPALTFP